MISDFCCKIIAKMTQALAKIDPGVSFFVAKLLQNCCVFNRGPCYVTKKRRKNLHVELFHIMWKTTKKPSTSEENTQ